MSRPTKAPPIPLRRREVYATDDDWAAIKTAARMAGRTISHYLIAGHRAGRVAPVMITLAALAPLASIQRAAERLADEAASRPAPETLAICARLAAIEALLADVIAGPQS